MHHLFLFFALLLLGIHSPVASDCTPSQHPNCVHWVRNGFCENIAYTITQRQSYCGIACGLCNSDGGPICIVDANPKCTYWAANGFCNSTKYTQAKKIATCCKSCGSQPATSSFSGTQDNDLTTIFDNDFYYFGVPVNVHSLINGANALSLNRL
ncbi:hypothetical protein PRIPAC_97768 [Pristionchus pacificus]|uniref:ShK domain-containing protein n=1 Tax=Pristionchus pacificus TaxID=54126 RepID=A0A454XZW3_PRIPA|nr:hypothetical protein PRIPAC_97768 [Pristionchus pacificus]|eukprot:PDM84370.1 ShK domain-containing protein [Pristionchus pacificus]